MVLTRAFRVAAFAVAVSDTAPAQLLSAAASAPGFGFALECGRCGSLEQGSLWRFSELPVVVAVSEGTAASRGGMRAGDTLVAIDALSLLTEAGSRRFANVRAGDRVAFTVGREGKRIEVSLTPTPARARAVGASCVATTSPRSSNRSTIERDGERGSKWLIAWKADDCTVELRAEGVFRLLPDLSDVESLSSGGVVKVDVRESKAHRELEVRSDNGRLVHDWKVDGKTTPWSDEARRWLGGVLVDLDRRTAFAIDARFPELFRRGGVNGVLDEIEQITAEFARAQYYTRLADSATLTVPDIRRIIGQLEAKGLNDFARGRILTGLQRQPGGNDPSLTADYIRTAGTLSTFGRTQVLESLIRRGPLTSESIASLVEALTARRGGLQNGRVFEELVRKDVLKPADLEMVIGATKRLAPDMTRSRVLEVIASRYKLEGTTRQAYIDAVRSLQSRLLRDRLLAALIDKER